MDDREQLRVELSKVAHYGGVSPAPPNEAATCDWIILPVLQSLGYDRHEILPQATEGRIGRPDYTILPDTEHTWFVEAKAWTVGLESTQADQALNYAHANGRRWVLLTNGREWRLYDDTIQGKAEDRLVGTASLEEADKCLELLASLTRTSVIGSKVERYVASTLVRKALDKDLRGPASATIKAIYSALKKIMPVEPSVRDIVSYFGQLPQAASVPIRVATDVVASQTGGASTTRPKVPIQMEVEGHQTYDVKLRIKGGEEATGIWNGKQLIVKVGSKGCLQPVESYKDTFEKRDTPLTKAYCRIEEGYRILATDIPFNSPSGAADFLNARSTNGWTEWRLLDGRPLDVLRHRKSS